MFRSKEVGNLYDYSVIPLLMSKMKHNFEMLINVCHLSNV